MDKNKQGVIKVGSFEKIPFTLTKAEISRAVAFLDPKETGEVEAQNFSDWMHNKTTDSFSTVRKMLPPEVNELIDKELAAEAAASVEEGGDGGKKDGTEANLPTITDEEAKALFAMLDEEGTGSLDRNDFLNMGEVSDG
jgi:Ca2+-binding EF-hand superfamily protein